MLKVCMQIGLATCGERLESYSDVRRHVRWAVGYDEANDTPTTWGNMLVTELGKIYIALDSSAEAEQVAQYRANTQKDFVNLTGKDFQ